MAKVWETDEVPFQTPAQVLSEPTVARAFARCLLQASIIDTWTELSLYLVRAVSQLPDVFDMSELQGWVDRFTRQTGYALEVDQVVIVDPDQEREQEANRFNLVG